MGLIRLPVNASSSGGDPNDTVGSAAADVGEDPAVSVAADVDADVEAEVDVDPEVDPLNGQAIDEADAEPVSNVKLSTPVGCSPSNSDGIRTV